jgi:hypothetical protein
VFLWATLCHRYNARTISFTDGLFKFTDGQFISPSVPTDNPYLPMVNRLTIGTDGTDEQCFRGLPYAIAIMLTISFTDGLFKFTDGEFISPSVPTDTDGRNNFTKLTVGMLATVLDNPRWMQCQGATTWGKCI